MNPQKENTYKAGSYIYIEGDEDVEKIYLVKKGEIGLPASNDRIKRAKTSVKAGDIFGFISSLCKKPRMESAVAVSDSVVVEFTRDTFFNLLYKNPDIAMKLINYFADELRAYDNIFMSFKESGEILSTEQKLYNLGRLYSDRSDNESAYYALNRYLALYPNGVRRHEASEMVRSIENTGFRKITEPIRQDLDLLYTDRQMVFCEHEPGDELYIIKAGKIKILKTTNDAEIMLSVLHEGDIFGELAIVSNKPRNATAVSFGNTKLLPVNMETLNILLNKAPDLQKKIFLSISQRVWFTYIRLESMLYEKPLTKIYALLENKLMEENISLKRGGSFTLNFGIDELLKMTDLTQEKMGNSINELLSDSNLSFNFGQIIINSPSGISAKARFYRTRDHLQETGEESEQKKHEISGPENVKKVDKVILENNVDARGTDSPAESGELFKELDKEIGQ